MKRKIRDGLSKHPPLLDTEISGHVGSDSHLVLRGYELNELARKISFEEVLYLLLYENLPDCKQLQEFSGILTERSADIPEVSLMVLDNFKGNERPLDVVTSCMAAISSTTKDSAKRSKQYLIDTAISIVSFYAALLSKFIAKRAADRSEAVADHHLGFSERFIVRCFGDEESAAKAKFLDHLLVLASDQGLTASTFAARVTASTRASFIASVIASLQAWNGYRHGSASEYAYRDLLGINARGGDIEGYINIKRREGSPVFGFGHRRYKKIRDPRVEVLASLSQEAFNKYGGTLYEAAQSLVSMLETSGRRFANPDLYVATLLESLGFRAEDAPAVVFMGRLAGISAHIIEENGPMRPMLRGESLYTGCTGRPIFSARSR